MSVNLACPQCLRLRRNTEGMMGPQASQVALVVKNPPANAGDVRDAGLIPGSGRCPGGRHDKLHEYSSLENPMDRGAWQAAVHRVTKSQKQLKRLSMYSGKLSLEHFTCAAISDTPIQKCHITLTLFFPPAFSSHFQITPQRTLPVRNFHGPFCDIS